MGAVAAPLDPQVVVLDAVGISDADGREAKGAVPKPRSGGVGVRMRVRARSTVEPTHSRPLKDGGSRLTV